VVKADWWKLGQLKAGNTLKFIRISLEDALRKRKRNDDFLDLIEEALKKKIEFDKIDNLQARRLPSRRDWQGSHLEESSNSRHASSAVSSGKSKPLRQ
jgi:allophanate hydrolase subunit 2